MHSLIFNSRSGRILMGGMQNKLVEMDLATGKETRVSIFTTFFHFLSSSIGFLALFKAAFFNPNCPATTIFNVFFQ